MKLVDLLTSVRQRLATASLATPDLDARLIVEHFTGTTRTDLITRPGLPVDPKTIQTVESAALRRLAGESVHRIFGYREFYGLKLALSSGTLEPRPDTETLVDAVLPVVRDAVAHTGQCRILDLGAGTGAGRLFEVDVRLRPDGAKGLLVSSLASFSEYQRERAWTWEHQALVRARAVAGDAALIAAFDGLRDEVLARPRDAVALAGDVSSMRRRMRAELDRSDGAVFDLKQGEGGLVDLEFLLQCLVMRDAAAHAALLRPRATPALLDAARDAGAIDASTHAALLAAHAVLLDAGMRCTLDRRPRRVPYDDVIERARAAIRDAARAQGLRFQA